MKATAALFPDRSARALQTAREAGGDVLLASDIGTVRWLSGRSAEIEYGPGNWTVGTHVLVTPGGGAIICPEEEQSLAPVPSGYSLETYEAFTMSPELVPEERAATALKRVLARAQVGAGATVAIESAALPAALLDALTPRRTVSIGSAIRIARAVKDAAEIALIRRAAELANVGQRAFRRHLQEGISEVELWSLLHGEMEQAAGTRVPVLPDLMFGDGCLEIGRPPTDRRLVLGELALCDLVPRRDGYWADSCVTIASGRPSAGALSIHAAAMRALEIGIRNARPGTTAGELDRLVRSSMAERGYTYPLHTGHGVGASGHEEPRIVPGATLILEEGMVVALEPGAYVAPDGVRIEHLMAVRPSGGELLTDYALDLT